jgi:hypothetical protein
LIKAAKGFGAEAVSLELVEFAEARGIVVPVLRHVVPAAILAGRVAVDHPERASDDVPREAEGPRVAAAWALERDIRRWRMPTPSDTPRPHPLDSPPPEAVWFLEQPSAVPWEAGIYGEEPIGRLPNGALLTERTRVPLYRRWQALMLTEFSDDTGVVSFSGEAMPVPPTEGPGYVRLSGWHAMRGFNRHRSSLEAVSWHSAYSRQALMHVEGEGRPRGGFVIRGDALTRLRALESGYAAEALERNGIGRSDVVSMVRWAAEQALELRGKGLPLRQAGYEELVEGGVSLLKAAGMAYADVEAAVGHGILERLFPDWMEGQIEAAMGTVRHVVLPWMQGRLLSPVAMPDEARARAFLEWLPTQGLAQVFWHFEELTALAQRHGDVADAGVRREVGGMAASLEHICVALGEHANGLLAKAKNLWTPVLPGIQAEIDRPLLLSDGQSRPGHGGAASFRESWQVVTNAYQDAGMGCIARDIRLAAMARNQVLHEGIGFLDRDEAIDLFILLFRLSFLTWHVRTP